MMTILAPLLIAIVGALVFALAKDKVAELGRLTFFAAMIALALVLATKVIHVP